MREHIFIRIGLPELIRGTAARINIRACGGVRTLVSSVADTVIIIVGKLAWGASRLIHSVDLTERCIQTSVHVIAHVIIVVIEDDAPPAHAVTRDITICAVVTRAIAVGIPIAFISVATTASATASSTATGNSEISAGPLLAEIRGAAIAVIAVAVIVAEA